MQLFLHLLRHPGDGLSLLEQDLGASPIESAKRSGLVWGFGLAVPGGAQKAPGLESWLGGPPRSPAGLWKTWGPPPAKQSKKGGRATAQGPRFLLSDGGEGMAEALDRLRHEATNSVDILHVALRLDTDRDALPRLQRDDRVAVYWELDDVLTSGLTVHLGALAEHLEEADGPPLELRLYSRWTDPSPERLLAICQSLGHPIPPTVPTAKEATWQIQ